MHRLVIFIMGGVIVLALLVVGGLQLRSRAATPPAMPPTLTPTATIAATPTLPPTETSTCPAMSLLQSLMIWLPRRSGLDFDPS